MSFYDSFYEDKDAPRYNDRDYKELRRLQAALPAATCALDAQPHGSPRQQPCKRNSAHLWRVLAPTWPTGLNLAYAIATWITCVAVRRTATAGQGEGE
jgi:hypothetical protein